MPLAGLGHVGPDGPVVLRLKGSYELVALHAEEQRRRLARPVADHRCVQVSILALHTDVCPVIKGDYAALP